MLKAKGNKKSIKRYSRGSLLSFDTSGFAPGLFIVEKISALKLFY